MSQKIPYESADGALGYITDVTDEDFYKKPKIELYDELEQSCYELVCNFAELIGVELDREEPDFRLANHIRDTVVELLEEEFKIPFPVYGETDVERNERLRLAKRAYFELEHAEKYNEICSVVSDYGDACVTVSLTDSVFVIDCGSSDSLRAIAARLNISSDNIVDSSVDHIAYVEVERERSLGLDEQIAASEAQVQNKPGVEKACVDRSER